MCISVTAFTLIKFHNFHLYPQLATAYKRLAHSTEMEKTAGFSAKSGLFDANELAKCQRMRSFFRIKRVCVRARARIGVCSF